MPSNRPVSFSNPDKAYFPNGFTKGEMLRYYIGIARTMVPHLRDRPVTLIRFPNGVKGQSFYEKNALKHAPAWIETFEVPRRKHDGNINYILVNNAETLAWCANLGAIEFHPFLHRANALDRPTHVAFDLDPGEGSDILTCVEVAFLLRALFEKLGLEAFPKVSGSKGIQIYVPLNTAVSFDSVTPFAKTVAELLAKEHPKLIVSQMSKALRKGRVMIDWSQNVEAKTTVAAAPVSWAELEKATKSRNGDRLFFSPSDTLKRVAKYGDLFVPVLSLKQMLPKAFLDLGPRKSSRMPASRVAAVNATSEEEKVEANTATAPQASGPARRPANRAKMQAPAFIEPMKPQLVATLPKGPEWAYEVKWDGYRALLLKDGDRVQLLSRNEKSLASDFPAVVRAGKDVDAESCVIDGEVVALDAEGKPAFQELQNRATTKATIVFYAFDLLAVDGQDITREPLSDRKARLAVIANGTALRLSPELGGTPAEIIPAVSKLGLEGVVAKRRDSAYHSGDGSNDLQKVRIRRGQEFVIGGFKPGMSPFESILVGYYEGKKLMFVGKVRPGFTPHTRRKLWDVIKGDEIDECPFANLPDAEKKGRFGEGITAEEMETLRWIRPKYIVQIEFVEWTSRGHLRHAKFTGIRTDKKTKDVRREASG